MNSRASAAISIWRARNARTIGDRAHLVYMALMVALIAVVPVARAVWLSMTSTDALAVFASPEAPAVTVLVVAALWAGALLLGRDRGPALLSPFLTHTFATSDLPQSATFRSPVVQAFALATSLTALASGLIGGSLLSAGLVAPLSAMAFIAAGVFVGLIGSVAWLAGQAFPRAAVPLALCVFALGATTAAVPSLQPFMPWGWVGLIYPTLGTPHLLAALAALATALVLVVPVLMNRLALEKLMAQAVRWDSAALNATVMDFGAATAIYRRRPHLGRRLRAVRPLGRQAAVFLVRDAIGATRTPGRLIVGVLALVVSGALITLALAPATPGWALGATAGLVLFAGLGPLTDGIRHAVHVAADFPIYGFSDGVLLANHMLFPLTVVIIVLFATVITGSLLLGNSATVPVVGSLILGALALIARVSSALKGPMPPALLTPMTTPMGDLGAGVRLIWALEGVLFASLIGASVALALQSPILLVSVAVSLVGVGLHRWRHRV